MTRVKRFVLLVFVTLTIVAGFLSASPGASAATAYQQSVLADSPSLFWEMNDGCCTRVAADSSGNGRAGTYASSGIVYHAAGSLGGVESDAIYDSGSIAVQGVDSGLPMGNASRSVEIWFKTTYGPDQILFEYGSQTVGNLFSLTMEGSGIELAFSSWTYPDGPVFDVPYKIADGQWHQVVVTYSNAGSGQIVLYLDGRQVASGAPESTLDTSGSSLAVGGIPDNPYDAPRPFNGSLEDFSVYPSVLTAAEVRQHYDAGAATVGAQYGRAVVAGDPSLYWPLNDAGCCTAVDDSGSGNNGAYAGSGITYGSAGAQAGDGSTSITADGTVMPVTDSDASLPSGNSARSVELWFKTSDTDSQVLFAYGSEVNGGLFTLITEDSGNELAFSSWTSPDGPTFDLNSSVADGFWHQLVLTYSGSPSDSLKLYLDGNLVGTQPTESALSTPSGSTLYLGGLLPGAYPRYFHGSLENFAVFPSVLTAADVSRQRNVARSNVPTAQSSRGSSEVEEYASTCSEPKTGSVDCATGDMNDSFTDVDVPGPAGGLVVSRTYSSLNADKPGVFGLGWSCSFCWSLSQDSTGAVTVTEGDGSQAVALPDGSGGYDLPQIDNSTLSQNSDGSWTFVRHQGDTYTFSASGQLESIVDANGYAVSFTYSASTPADLTSISDDGLQTLTVETNSSGEITGITDPLGHETTYGYNSADELASVTNQDGDEWQYGYNGSDQMTSMTNPDGDTTTTTFDSSGRVLTQTRANGAEYRWSYTGDPFSDQGGSTVITDPDGNQEYQFYADGELQSLVKGYGTSSAETTSYTWDPVTGGMASETDPRGKTTTYTYDGDGNILTKTDPLGNEWSYSYNEFDEPLTATDPLGVTTTNTYDPDGNLLTTSTPLLNGSGATIGTQETQYTYTDMALPGYPTGVEDPNGKTTDYVYNSQGDAISQTDPLGNETTYTYDADGRLLSTVAPKGNVTGCSCAGSYTTSYTYNALNEPLTETDADGNESTSTYDADGNELTSTEPSGNETVTTYNDVNEPTEVQVKDPGGSVKQTTGTGYDLDGDVTSQTDGDGNETTYAYNPLGEQTSATNALGKVTTYTYDPDGNLATEVTPDGSTVTDGYNDDDELTATIYSGGASTPSVGYTYDADGRQTGMSDGTGSSTWAYNSLGELTSYTNGAGSEVGYGYDLDGNQISITYPGGHVLTQTYDDDGDLKTLTDWNSNESTFAYDPDGNLITEALANGVGDAYTYDHAGNLTGIDDSDGLATVFSATYALNSDELVATDSSQPTSTGSYGYTALDQLCYAGSETSSACSSPPSGADAYSYDPAGNLTDNNGTTQAYNAGDQLCWTTASSSTNGCGTAPTGATTYTYDSDGNRTATTPASGSATAYGYNGSDELTRYQLGTSPATTYAYDGDGELQSQTTSGTATSYTWDASASIPVLLQQTTGGNTTSYIYGPQGLPLEEILPSGGTYYYAHDQLGSTRALTDSTGTVQDTDDYDPYGNTTSSTGTVPNPLLYTGGLKDPESGLYFAQARYYDPTTGQFLTVDPLVAATGQPYAYTDGDPINGTDPTGLASAPEGAGLAGILIDPIPEPISTGPEVFVPAPTPDPAPDYPVSGPLITGPESYPAADPSPDQPECFPSLDGSGLSIGTIVNAGGHEGDLPAGGEFPYLPPKAGHGSPVKLKNGQGWRAEGQVQWQWDYSGHRGPHWDVTLKDGTHINVDTNGKIL